MLISGSDDKKIKLWDWQLGKQVLAFHSGHIDNVFQARFLPASTFTIASSAADGQIRAAVLSNHGFSSSRRLWQHDGRAHKIALTNNPSTFLSCGEDGSIVHHDLRQKHPAAHCCVHNSTRKVELYSVCTNPSNRSEFCIAGQQKDISVFDLRRFGDSKRAIHLCSFRPNCLPLYDISCTAAIYNRKGEILASYNDDFIYLFNRSVQENLDSEIVYNQGEDNGVKLFQSPPGIHQFFSASVSVLKTDFCKEQTDDDSSMSHSDDSHLELSEEGYGDCFTTYDEILRSYSRRISDDYGSTEDENEFSVEIDGEESTSSSSEENNTSSEMESEEETDLDEEDLVNQTDSEGLRYFLDNGVSNVFLGKIKN